MKGLDKYLTPPEDNEVFFEELEELVIQWGKERGLLDAENGNKQLIKTGEELGELFKAELENNQRDRVDAIGDVLVTLILYARINKLNITDCLDVAYQEIRLRTGKTVDGTFIKDAG